MRYCKRCVYPENHPLGLMFDEEGICSGCRVHEEKDTLDWEYRLQKLKNIVQPYKALNRSINDCIVPVSGARDSYFTVHIVKNVLGMNPLLVTYNKHYNTEVGHRNLSYLKTKLGAPLLTLTVSPERVRRITRETLRLMCSIYWHCLAGQTVFPVQTAFRFRIPLIIWGCHQGVDQVGMFSHTDEVEMTRKYRKEHDLLNYEAENLLEKAELEHADIEPYIYPHDKEIEAVGIRGIYLNNYIRWDTKAQHESMIELYGYETRKQDRTFDTYSDVDCFHYTGLHDYIKNVKHGYSKITDHVSREIRLGRLNRRQGSRLVEYYTNNRVTDLSQFSDWLPIGKQELVGTIHEQARSAGNRNLVSQREVFGLRNVNNSSTAKSVDLENHDLGISLESSRLTAVKKETEYKLISRGWVGTTSPKLVRP